ncbi:alpha/beta hydrolase [Nocardia sp. NPDC050793]|uniref:alpha/beta fold hydrolase n=1 Tax=Nocardia sp. NPDC050793 TaxID=3155159 RepID=UPI0033EC7EFE
MASDYPGDDTRLDLDALADALVAAAVDAHVEAFTVIGFSLGTAVAVRAAVRHPGRVRGLLLAAGFAKPDNRARIIGSAEMLCARPEFVPGRARLPADEQRLALFVVVDAEAVVDAARRFDGGAHFDKVLALDADGEHLGGGVGRWPPPPVGVVTGVRCPQVIGRAEAFDCARLAVVGGEHGDVATQTRTDSAYSADEFRPSDGLPRVVVHREHRRPRQRRDRENRKEQHGRADRVHRHDRTGPGPAPTPLTEQGGQRHRARGEQDRIHPAQVIGLPAGQQKDDEQQTVGDGKGAIARFPPEPQQPVDPQRRQQRTHQPQLQQHERDR